ncbi:4-oxalocrotonate decarboxylase [Patulibacter medicamentivorans]|uniref:4-oxalocrotonate decarboxylase n=1 Tax=Patulibacter medicamentivorans TaxID=1097667 RepID=H0DZT0_9ACTN|nr:fumarylacetoacetate hydrolase family protein [Patulibacter medicamentivorans]EHN13034.1 4-oxalocrotonate decarboxylase [Patulibacter medicamentivorans]
MSASERVGLEPATLRAIAELLARAEGDRDPIAPPSATHPDLTVEEAYEIQAINARARAEDPAAAIVGHKIGLTSRAMQEMLGVDEPDYGCLYADRVLDGGASIAAADLIAPRIEPEIAFVLAEPLATADGAAVTAQDVLAATAYVVPSIEVIDSRISDWRITLVDTIADNASCARVVLGATRTPPGDVDLAAAAVDLRVNGESLQRGVGSAVLGHPAEAVAWLANALAGHGVTLAAGQVLMPGSLTAAVPFERGDHVVADFGPLGAVEVHGA